MSADGRRRPPGSSELVRRDEEDQAASAAHRALAALGARLRHLREDAGLSGRELARRAAWHASKVSRIEHGAQTPSATDIRTWCANTAAADQADELIATMRVVDSLFTEWRRLESWGLTALQESVVPVWERTKVMRFYSPFVIPTPLQTPEYARALLEGIRDRRSRAHYVEAAVESRMLRQQRALQSVDLRIIVLVEESALRYLTGSPEIMAAQLGYLLAVGTMARVSLGIIPPQVDRTATWPVEAFYLHDDDEVHLELVSGSMKFTQPHEVSMYAAMFRDLSAIAVRGAEARALISRAITAVDA